ncbi:MAG: PH domain-containing protein [Bacilli bacterium]|nr:PH domain-containing protein [Bacilli bacterium]
MAYLKYKEVTKYFNFSKALLKEELPSYVTDYIFEEEDILCGYKTARDYGVFTTKKIVLFDNTSTLGISKQIYTIPYNTISTISIIFTRSGAELSLFLNSGYPLRIKFINMTNIDKKRVRLIYSIISKIINNQKVSVSEIKKIQENDISFN